MELSETSLPKILLQVPVLREMNPEYIYSGYLIDILISSCHLSRVQTSLFASDFSSNVFVHIFSLSHVLFFAHLILPYFITLCIYEEPVVQFGG